MAEKNAQNLKINKNIQLVLNKFKFQNLAQLKITNNSRSKNT